MQIACTPAGQKSHQEAYDVEDLQSAETEYFSAYFEVMGTSLAERDELFICPG